MKKINGFIAAAVIAFSSAQAAASGGRVLLVHSYNTGYPWVDSITRGVRQTLAGSGIQLEVFYMDTKRNTGLEWKTKSGEMAMERVKALQPDVVIAADDNAQEYFAKKLAGQENPRVVFLGVNADPAKYGYPASNITGILERPFVAETMSLLKEISPQAKTAAVITDKSETSDGVIEYIKSLKALPLRIVMIVQPETFKEWQETVEKAQHIADAIIFNTYHTVRRGNEKLSMSPGEVIKWTLANNTKPEAGLLEFNMEDGVMCGVAESGEEYGREAGEMARQMITAGKTANDFPVKITEKGIRMINISAAGNLGITIPGQVIASADRIVSDLKTDPRATLSALVAFADEYIGGVLNGLRLLSVTEPVIKGDWETMKPLLSKLAENVSGTVWFARPDGTYFTAEKGLAEQKINDRPYFDPLMKGQVIAGELVISRSTGKKSAVIAVPVLRGGRVTGAVGTSLYLDDMAGLIDEKLDLPEDMTFYALDGHGRTALHRDPGMMFEFPGAQDSRTLAKAAGEIISKEEGIALYEFSGMSKTVFYKRSALTDWHFALGFQEPVLNSGKEAAVDPETVLAGLKVHIDSLLNKIDSALALASGELSKTGLTGTDAEKILKNLCAANPEVIDCAAVDAKGIMVAVEPEEYHNSEGADISSQEQVAESRRTKKPVLSKVFRSVEGFSAVDLEYPVFSSDGQLAGTVSLLLRPEFILSSVITPAVQGLPVEAWLMQQDGRILYDREQEEVGRMLFDDPLYKPFPSLLEIGEKIAAEEAGRGSYEFLGRRLEKPVKKETFWTSVGIHGTQWRLVLTKEAQQ